MQRSERFRPSQYFQPLDLSAVYNRSSANLAPGDCSAKWCQYAGEIPTEQVTLRGIPFQFGGKEGSDNIIRIEQGSVSVQPDQPLADCRYVIFAHQADSLERQIKSDDLTWSELYRPVMGEEIGEYTLIYEDGSSHAVKIKKRFNINDFILAWGEGAFECVPHVKPRSIMTDTEASARNKPADGPSGWGNSQTRVLVGGTSHDFAIWLYALENPHPEKKIASVHLEATNGRILVYAISACNLTVNPLRWESRKKATIRLPSGITVDAHGDLVGLDLDLGEIISVQPQLVYPVDDWTGGYNNQQPEHLSDAILIEYTAHPAARLFLDESNETFIDVSALEFEPVQTRQFAAARVPAATKRVMLRVLDRQNRATVPVKIHMHGASGEYLPPMNRHRIPNPFWYEDYSADFVHGSHLCTYIDGEAEYRLPLGEIFVEVSKGFEIRPVRQVFQITGETSEIVIELDHVLPWREKGWVTADTHVHFLSPSTALLEGEAEGVNIVNLLASQWGELFTNIADFDGRTTLGSRENGGKGEFLVRVGTENRQQILGHISLLGYNGKMILPLTTGGPDESALGDPVEETLSGWARRCREQQGVVVLPHHPNPRAEGAAAIVAGLVDGVEMTSWGDLYSGINPYSLADWYRYLNCGYHVAAVGGTDKMSANTAVGTVRTYARIKDKPFTYDNWKDAIRSGHTFASYGPLLEFQVEGAEMGGKIDLPRTGGTLQIAWAVASVTVPVTQIELVVNGQTREFKRIEPGQVSYAGTWAVPVQQNCWLALRVRGAQPGKPEMIAAHSSAVMVQVAGESCFNAVDALSILEQIEGATAYIKTLATRAEEKVYKELLLTLTAAHRSLHNRMHRNGLYHNHTVVDDHHHEKH